VFGDVLQRDYGSPMPTLRSFHRKWRS
jgi:hypothetical protein